MTPAISNSPELASDGSRLELTVASGPLLGLSGSAAPRDRLLVGRAQNCQLRVVDPRMSREHFVTRFTGGRWWIEDLASSNGTLVNGQRIVATIELRYGDVVQAGDTRFRVSVAGNTPSRMDAGSPHTMLQQAHHQMHEQVNRNKLTALGISQSRSRTLEEARHV